MNNPALTKTSSATTSMPVTAISMLGLKLIDQEGSSNQKQWPTVMIQPVLLDYFCCLLAESVVVAIAVAVAVVVAAVVVGCCCQK